MQAPGEARPATVKAGRGGDSCPQCGHDRSGLAPQSPFEWLLTKLGRARPARCETVDADVSGWSTDVECPCRHTFHGS